MAVKVLWSDTALTQLQDIFEYYSFKASNAVARKVIKGIVKKSILLEANPLIGTIEPLLAARPFEYRFIVEKNYKVIYRFNDSIAYVVAVFDCRQNPEKIKRLEE